MLPVRKSTAALVEVGDKGARVKLKKVHTTMPNEVTHALEIIKGYYAEYGYLTIFSGLVCENTTLIGFFIPGVFIIIIGGFYAQQHVLSLPFVVLFAFLGTFIGDVLSYAIGYYGWRFLLEKAGVTKRLPKIRQALEKEGGKYILFYNFSAYLRLFVPAGAGIIRFPFLKYSFFDGAGALLWSLTASFIGYFIASFKEAHQLTKLLGLFVLLIYLAFIVISFVKRWASQSKR